MNCQRNPDHTTVENEAGGNKFWYCKDCKLECLNPQYDAVASDTKQTVDTTNDNGQGIRIRSDWVPALRTLPFFPPRISNRSTQYFIVNTPSGEIMYMEVGQRYEIASVNRQTGDMMIRLVD